MSGWVWVVPEEKGGIRWYSDTLWPGISAKAPAGSRMLVRPTIHDIAVLKPSLVHIQHEYGCYGSKTPGRYKFPGFLRRLRRALPKAKIIATAHTVIREDYWYPTRGRGWQIPLRAAANAMVVPHLALWWNKSTWGPLDATIVQSSLFVDTVKRTGCPRIREIPLFVPDVSFTQTATTGSKTTNVIVFGYFSHDKGQDVAIRAMKELSDSVHLVLAGGVRRPEDQAYFDECKTLVRQLGLEKRVTITGFVGDADMDSYYQDATLVLAPFRESMGSGSIGQAFARSKPVLASDLAANQEIVGRMPGSLVFFHSENPADCAIKIRELLVDTQARSKLSDAGHAYAEKYSVRSSVQAHLSFYEELGVGKSP